MVCCIHTIQRVHGQFSRRDPDGKGTRAPYVETSVCLANNISNISKYYILLIR